MATEKRLIDANELLAEVAKTQALEPDKAVAKIIMLITEAESVDAVILPYKPRPMLKDRNPHNLDVYCPECGTNLSGYYGEDRLPIVTCFFCGEILDPCKATTRTNGERENDGQ